MENKVNKLVISNQHTTNAKTIKISTNTHRLIISRAMINDAFDTVTDVICQVYGCEYDAILQDFRNSYGKLDNEVCKLIGQSVRDTTLKGGSATGAFIEM